jgi:DNA-binding transcriptional ArsR family regulator
LHPGLAWHGRSEAFWDTVCELTVGKRPSARFLDAILDTGLDKVFKALGDPSRRQLLDHLCTRNGQTLGELCEHLDMTRQAVTQHLGVLEAANLVVTIWRGREKLHYLNPVPLQDIYERWIRKFERQRLRALHDLKKRLEGEGDE